VHAFAEADGARDRAFESLYRRYVPDVYRYTLAVLRNPADAEDVTQTTFLNAYRAYKRGEEPIKPQHWLIKIAHNACLSRYQRAGRRPQEVPLDESAELAARDEARAPVPELLEALGRLPFNQRSALVMRELEGRSYREIAETLGTSVAAVETLIFRARRTLRKDRRSLQSLGAVQVPPSLASFFGGGGAVAGGGAAIGSGLLAKAALLFTAALAVGGVAEKTSDAARKRSPIRAAAPAPSSPTAVVARLPVGVKGALELVGGRLVLTRAAAPGQRLVVRGGGAVWEPVAPLGGESSAGDAVAAASGSPTPGVAGPLGASPAGPGAASVPGVSSPVAVPTALPGGTGAPSLPAPSLSGTATTSVSTPAVTSPSVTTPSASTPSASTPVASVPSVSAPSATVPSVTVPSVTAPTVTAPTLTTPSATVPATPVTPPVTVPSTTVTLPPPPTLP
jgi:RNA polymerase sigma factor (sigma-70 family)